MAEKIIIIDDCAFTLKHLETALIYAGYDVYSARSGREGQRLIAEQSPNLILLDVLMPDVDGFQVIETLKADAAFSAIPVIFLTGQNDTGDEVRGFDLGAVDYILKPVKIDVALARIAFHLKFQALKTEQEESIRQLEKLNRDKNEILGFVAHDLKNPLYSINGFARIVQERLHDTPADVIMGYLQVIENASQQMTVFIDELLDVQAIESDSLSLDTELVLVSEIFESLANTYADRADRKGIELDYDVTGSGNPTLINRLIFEQVLDNLVSNAIKFSPPCKRVVVRADIGKYRLVCKVEDEGPGFTAVDKDSLFGKFKRLSARPTGDEGSNGLGLYIVKSLLDKIGGSIACESEPGHGATFTFDMPIEE